jgi:probable rRNA maturation factor
MLDELGLAGAELSVVLTDDAEIRELNRVFRQKDRPTDVLAFAMREGDQGPRDGSISELLGDVILSTETARRQAEQHEKTLDAEVCMLLAHGLLHLIGYDHQTDDDERKMTVKTVELCRLAEPIERARGGRRKAARRAKTRS